ncbi:GTPase HflX [Paenibacillus oceani]|uniref:GTPase HflX n=1 Tax=Paenibacillus oceani TaxID=2772510 RepID=A0A927CBA7_9BACL|nr:GTPase HflX [Paenibacillus oceani]MBD2863106.1 GTPase HflX [Paenibacillus oceani]
MEQKAIIVGVNLNDQSDFTDSMEELKNLAAACDVDVVGELTQNASKIHISHYIGTGKVKEVKELLEQRDASIAIFNDELSPSQIRNLEKDLDCKVIDRTILILDIFADRAQTREAQLQVDVAQLQYMLPRLIGLRESLGRQGGGVGMKNRGAGETKLELDRRRIEAKISALQKELEGLVAQRQVQRKQRQKNRIPVVSLVGYTNAGKSSLMNAILETYNPESGKQVLAKDMLFATLETSVRNITLPDNKAFLLTDTVGFVRKLPHHLIKAFRSTLEEVSEADLLIHVVDYSNPEHEKLIEVTRETVEELGAGHIPVIYAYNKAELTDGEWPANEEERVYISARHKTGLDELMQRIRSSIFGDYVRCDMLVPFDQGRLIAYFNDNANVTATSYEENGTKLTMECRRADYEKYQAYIVEGEGS